MLNLDPETEAQVRESLLKQLNTVSPDAQEESLPTSTVPHQNPWFDKVGLWDSESLTKGKKVAPAVDGETGEEGEEEGDEDEDFLNTLLTDEELEALLVALEGEEEEPGDSLTPEEVEELFASLDEEEEGEEGEVEGEPEPEG